MKKLILTLASLFLGSLVTTSHAAPSPDCALAQCDLLFTINLVQGCKLPNKPWWDCKDPDRLEARALKNKCKMVMEAVCRPDPKTGTYLGAVRAGLISWHDIVQSGCWYSGYLGHTWAAGVFPPDVCWDTLTAEEQKRIQDEVESVRPTGPEGELDPDTTPPDHPRVPSRP